MVLGLTGKEKGEVVTEVYMEDEGPAGNENVVEEAREVPVPDTVNDISVYIVLERENLYSHITTGPNQYHS